MKSNEVIAALTAALRGNRTGLLDSIRRMECHERNAGNATVAQRLAGIVRNYGCDRGEMIALPGAWNGLSVVTPAKSLDDLILADDVHKQIAELAVEHSKIGLLNQHGLRPRNRLLFHGPPGNGKTAAAESLANLLAVPFLFVNHHDLIDSHLGESAKNLSNAMKTAANQPCVLFIDEFDSVGHARHGNSAAEKESNRIVSSLLMQLDSMPASVTFVAATNAIDLLDSALLRRFDSRIEFQPPNEMQVVCHVEVLKRRHPILKEQKIDWVSLAGLSYAEIETRLMNLARTVLIAL